MRKQGEEQKEHPAIEVLGQCTTHCIANLALTVSSFDAAYEASQENERYMGNNICPNLLRHQDQLWS